jgi:CRISPR system Cascade subunit CasD
MSTDTAYLALLLDAPLQSWGFASRFQRRTTGLHPTKSGVIGLICAAMGHSKRPIEEDDLLHHLAALKMTCIVIPRHDMRRLEDFHTVLKTRRASGKINEDAVVTRRQYLLDACFGVILEGDRGLLGRVSSSLKDPVWGVWLGRKNCIPSALIHRGLFEKESEAQAELIGNRSIEVFTTVGDVERFEDGTDSLSDQPVSFGDGTSSGPDKRQFAIRRIALKTRQ